MKKENDSKKYLNESKIKKNNVLNFPEKLSSGDREVEAVVFAAAEPLDIDTIESRVSKKIDLTFTSILWHYLLKGIEDLKLFPDSFIALQMLTTRLCRLKDMPDPQKMREENVDLNLSSSKESVVKCRIYYIQIHHLPLVVLRIQEF